MTVADIDLAERLIGAIGAAMRADGLGDDPGILLELGRLQTRLDAVRALSHLGREDETHILARTLLLAIARAFPTRIDWSAERSDETLHLRREAVGRALLTEGATL